MHPKLSSLLYAVLATSALAACDARCPPGWQLQGDRCFRISQATAGTASAAGDTDSNSAGETAAAMGGGTIQATAAGTPAL